MDVVTTIANLACGEYLFSMEASNELRNHLALEPLAGRERYLAAAYWQENADCHRVVHLTAQRVLKYQIMIGPIRVNNARLETPFFGRMAHIELQSSGSADLLDLAGRPSLTEGDLGPIGMRAVAWARAQAPRRLSSPFLASKDRPARWSLTHIAFLYDTYQRLGDPAPVESIAKATGMTVSAARSKVHRARKEALLSQTRRGEPGGHLTDKGRELVAQDPFLDDMKSFYFELNEET